MAKKGYKQTKEHREKGAKSRIGKIISKETKKKISESEKGKIISIETRRKLSKAQIGQHHSPATEFKKGHEAIKGEAHSRWNPDREVLKRNKRNDPEYKQWVKKVKKRDNNTCQLKDENCNGYNIAHHIKNWSKYLELRYMVSNGITLCQIHHPRTRTEEKQLKKLFFSLVANKEK